MTRLHRPEPVLNHQAAPVDMRTPPWEAASQLRDGKQLIVIDRYRTGATILAQLQRLLPPAAGDASFAARRAARSTYRKAAMRLLAPIKVHKLALEGAPPIGFLKELYPDRASFTLSFPDAQALNAAWGRYQTGHHFPVLGQRIHPFYGVYAPTRSSHLELFATWLSTYTGARKRAADVGTGCGVLALMLGRAGFKNIVATDINPNAIESVTRELARLESPPNIEPRCCDLLTGTGESDLIVFNPPWVQGDIESPLDQALYFEAGLFERFFDQAIARLADGGRIVVLFSSVLELVQPDVPHPIETELERGRLVCVSKLRRKVRPPADARGNRRRTRERVEVWELALA
ncbi:MAG: SAM-dependent methyltransferase [Myxococcota bacterium]|jgi:SAM-dependent methyltransferase